MMVQIVIDHNDFRRLSPNTQAELLAAFTGTGSAAPAATQGRARVPLHWRQPVDITPEQAARLVHGLSEDHKRRLALFGRKDGRVRMKDIMAVAGDTDLRSTSEFQKAITRRLRRIIADPEKKAQLIFWDFDTTKWDAAQTAIVDGCYYVSEASARALAAALGAPKAR